MAFYTDALRILQAIETVLTAIDAGLDLYGEFVLEVSKEEIARKKEEFYQDPKAREALGDLMALVINSILVEGS